MSTTVHPKNTEGEPSSSTAHHKVNKAKTPKEFKSDNPTHHHPDCCFNKWNTRHRSSLLSDEDVAETFTAKHQRILKPSPIKDQLVKDFTNKAMSSTLIRTYMENERKMYDSYKSIVLSLCVCESAKKGVPWGRIPEAGNCDLAANLPPPPAPPVVIREEPVDVQPMDNPETMGNENAVGTSVPVMSPKSPVVSSDMFSVQTDPTDISNEQLSKSTDGEETRETKDDKNQSGGVSDTHPEKNCENIAANLAALLNLQEHVKETDNLDKNLEQVNSAPEFNMDISVNDEQDQNDCTNDPDNSAVSVGENDAGNENDSMDSSDVSVEPYYSSERDKILTMFKSYGLDLSEDELDYTDC